MEVLDLDVALPLFLSSMTLQTRSLHSQAPHFSRSNKLDHEHSCSVMVTVTGLSRNVTNINLI